MAHTKWIETVLNQCKVLRAWFKDHVYLDEAFDFAKKGLNNR